MRTAWARAHAPVAARAHGARRARAAAQAAARRAHSRRRAAAARAAAPRGAHAARLLARAAAAAAAHLARLDRPWGPIDNPPLAHP